MQPTGRQVQSCFWFLLVLVSLSLLQHLNNLALRDHLLMADGYCHMHFAMDVDAMAGCSISNCRVAEMAYDSYHRWRASLQCCMTSALT